MENTIFINGAITQNTFLETCKLFRQIENEGKKEPINLVINSCGGDLQSTLGILDCIDLLHNEVNTFALTKCSSAAVFLFLKGTKRYVSKNSIFVIHEPFISIDNETSLVLKDLIFEYEKLSMYNLKLFQLFEEKTKLTKSFLEKKYSENNWLLTCEDAMKFGISTDIATTLP